MGRGRMLCVVLAAGALIAGCGDDDDGGDAATTSTQTVTTTEAQSGGAPTKAELEACLTKAGLELKPGTEPVTGADGETKSREGLDIEGAEYLGYVQWPSKHVSDIYLADDEAAGANAEKEASTFIKAFGKDPAKYVRRSGAVVLTLDDPPATDEETKAVLDCAGGGGAAPAQPTEPEEMEPEAGGGGAKVAEAEAEESAREEASAELEKQGGGFSVNEADWQVTCTGGESGGPWNCQLDSGPCNGTAVVTPKPDGSRVTVAKVGCVAD